MATKLITVSTQILKGSRMGSKPKLLWRGRDRALISHLRTFLNRVKNRDVREAVALNESDINPLYFSTKAADNAALDRLIARCNEALAEKG